jgi:radical SAM superfamily enzyme YgiQ (UPF0313 family)
MKVLIMHPGDKRFVGIPLSLGYIIGYLKKNNIETYFLDSNFCNSIKKEIKRINPDIVGIGCATASFNLAIEIAKACKEINKNIITVLGGYHPSTLPRETLQNPFVDFIVQGEGEETMLELVKAIKNNGNFKNVKGIGFKKNNSIIINRTRSPIQNIDKLPMPHPFLPLENYYETPPSQCWDTKKGYFSIMYTSRSCPFSCKFCAIHTTVGRKYRAHSPERVIDEIKYLTGKRVYNIRFVDALFTLNKNRVINICKNIIDEGLDIGWTCNAHAKFIDNETLYWMKKAGCHQIGLGIESGSQKLLDNINKGIKLSEVKRAVELSKKNEIEVLGYFLFGLPGETYKTALKTIEWAKTLDCDYTGFNVLVPYPGTEVYNWYKEHDFILSNDWNDYYMIRNVIIKTEELSNEELSQILRYAHISFYLRPSKLIKIFKNISSKGRFRVFLNENLKRLSWMLFDIKIGERRA